MYPGLYRRVLTQPLEAGHPEGEYQQGAVSTRLIYLAGE